VIGNVAWVAHESHVWAVEQIVAFAGSSARFGAGEAVALPSRWSRTGCSERALWGRYHGSGSEPYDVSVDHAAVAARCSCPSRAHPCKHVVALLVLWTRGHVGAVAEPPAISTWADRQQRRVDDEQASAGTAAAVVPAVGADRDTADGSDRDEGDGDQRISTTEAAESTRNERIERLVGGLVELDRWLEDRLRAGLADPTVARFATWDEVARRLTDARAGALANRVRRLAGRVGAEPEWHDGVLAEMGVLHLLARAGQRVPQLPSELADGVAVACGWQVRKADVEASAPRTDRWLVVGRSDVREDLVEVRRVWLRGIRSGEWAMVLSFAAYRQALDTTLIVGSIVDADLHRYPGSAQRAIVGSVHDVDHAAKAVTESAAAAATSSTGACALVGSVLAGEPWLERVPAIVRSTITRSDGEWLLTDDEGSLVIAAESMRSDAVATLLAATGGQPATVAVEWTPRGVVPLTVFLPDRTIDVGPRADASFVSAA
jgi:SWIM zinc finger